jgi:hypothetical protein
MLTAVKSTSSLLSHVPIKKIAMIGKGVHAVASIAETIVDKTSGGKKNAPTMEIAIPKVRQQRKKKKGKNRKKR